MYQSTVSQVRSWRGIGGIITGVALSVAPVHACVEDADCEDGDVCTWDRCIDSACEFWPSAYGDVDHSGTINVFDLFCILNGSGGNFSEECNEEDCDITGNNTCLTCGPNGTINVFDLFAVLNTYGGGDSCCSGAPCPVQVPGGEFQMGDSFNEGSMTELPVHTVYLSTYYVDTHEVTNQQYADALNRAFVQGLIDDPNAHSGVVYGSGGGVAYCDTTTSSSYSRITWNGSTFGVTADKEDHPMVEVSWYGSVAYCNWRSALEGRDPSYNLNTWECDFGANGYRLPTEAEWEKAARGGMPGHRFPWSDTDTIQHARANYRSSSHLSYDTSQTRGSHPTFSTGGKPYTSPVGYFAPNGYGLYDITGNVWEWCHDWLSNEYYSSSPGSNPTGPPTGTYRVLRGGCWANTADLCRSTSRSNLRPGDRAGGRGFRCVVGTP